jgi:hypothetical protein
MSDFNVPTALFASFVVMNTVLECLSNDCAVYIQCYLVNIVSLDKYPVSYQDERWHNV